MFFIKSETVVLSSSVATLSIDKTKVLLWGGERGGDVTVPFCSNLISQDFFWLLLGILLIGFDNELQGFLQVWRTSQEKVVPEAADLTVPIEIRAFPACSLPAPSLLPRWVAGVLPGSSATWPRMRLPARPLHKAEVFRKPKWLFLSGWVGNSERCYL